MLDRPEVVVLVAERGGEPVGYVCAVRRLHLWLGTDILTLDDVFVRDGHRDAGAGRLLMAEPPSASTSGSARRCVPRSSPCGLPAPADAPRRVTTCLPGGRSAVGQAPPDYAPTVVTGRPRAAPGRPEGEMDAVLAVLAIVMLGLFVLLGASVRVITQFERGVVLRFGRLHGDVRAPGLALIAPGADRLHKVNMQVVTMPVPAQEGITRDNVTVKVDAVVYFKVFDPVRVVVHVQNYQAAIAQVAQASLRSIIGKSELDDLLSNRERLNQGLELMLDSPAVDWGIHIDRVDIKDVALPESMKRSMSRQAEAERERRSRVITAEGELQASEKLAQAAEVMTGHPAALQLRLLQTVVEVAAEKNSTLVLPFPVELLRFLERATPQEAAIATPAPSAPEIPEPRVRTEAVPPTQPTTAGNGR